MPDTPAATPNDIPARVAVLEEIARHTAATLDRIDRRLDVIDQRLDQRLDAMDRRIAGLDQRVGILDQRLDTHFRWVVGLYIAGFASLLGVMAHGFHWL